jgi:hypothetical protein
VLVAGAGTGEAALGAATALGGGEVSDVGDAADAGPAGVGAAAARGWGPGWFQKGRYICEATISPKPATLAATSQPPRRQGEGRDRRRAADGGAAGWRATAASTRARRAARASSSLSIASASA